MQTAGGSVRSSQHGLLLRGRRVCGKPMATATWGTYKKVTSEGADGDRAGSVWRRSSGGGSIALPLGSEAIGPVVPDAHRPDVVIRGRVTRQGSRRLISVFLVNEQATPLQNRDEGWLFQAVLGLTVDGILTVFLARDGLADATEASDPELPQLDMLYRDEVEFAVGHGTAVHVTGTTRILGAPSQS